MDIKICDACRGKGAVEVLFPNGRDVEGDQWEYLVIDLCPKCYMDIVHPILGRNWTKDGIREEFYPELLKVLGKVTSHLPKE